MIDIHLRIFVLAAFTAQCCAHAVSGNSGQEHLAFMQQKPDSAMRVVHHVKRPDSIMHHVKGSTSVASGNHVEHELQSSPSSPSESDPLTAGTWSKIRGSLWLVSRACIALAIVSLGIAFGFWRFGKHQTPMEFVSAMPTVSSPTDMQVGTWVKVVGTVASVDQDAPFKSILEGRPCVYSEASAVVPETRVTVARHEATCDLQVVCEKGSADLDPVLVHASDAKVLEPKPVLDAVYVRKLMPPDFEDFVKDCPTPGHCGEESLALHALQFQEKILEVNTRVAIVGVVSVSPSGRLCLVPDTVAHLQKTEGCRQTFRRHMQSFLSSADAQFMSSHVVIIDEKKTEDSNCPGK
jgi:hypothetical protein